MPFKSKAQARFMFSQHPAMAKEWAKETPSIKELPAKLGLQKAAKRKFPNAKNKSRARS